MMGKIFYIEEFATFDGPDIRMPVFFKVCPLRCVWCHNPEGQRLESEYIKSPNGCIMCGECIKAADILSNGENRLGERFVAVCPMQLVRLCGEDISTEKLCERPLSNACILSSTGGGVTFLGGEPLVQSDFYIIMKKR